MKNIEVRRVPDKRICVERGHFGTKVNGIDVPRFDGREGDCVVLRNGVPSYAVLRDEQPALLAALLEQAGAVKVCARYDESRGLVIAVPHSSEPTLNDKTCGLGTESGWSCWILLIREGGGE